MDSNTTPLIDVMLVLLIMFIITIPVQTHAVKLDLPQSTPQDNPPRIDPIKNVVRIDQANTIYWNGTAVDPATLKSYLRQTTQMDPERSEEHTSELQSLMRTSYAVFCLNKKNIDTTTVQH